jgi:hypothetical protein
MYEISKTNLFNLNFSGREVEIFNKDHIVGHPKIKKRTNNTRIETIDKLCYGGTRGIFARLCIQIDIDKPLTRTVRVGKTRLAVIYEGVSLLCFHCGKIGHRRERCPIRALEESELPSANDQSSLVEEDKPKGFGPWMIVARRKRQTKPVGSLDHAEGPSAVQGHANAQQHGFGATDQLAGSSDAMRREMTH